MKKIKTICAYVREFWSLSLDVLTQTVRVRVGDRIERVTTPFNFSDLNDLFGEGNWKLLGEFKPSFNSDKYSDTWTMEDGSTINFTKEEGEPYK